MICVHFLNVSHYNVQVMNTVEKEDSLTLSILEEIEKNQGVTQRHLASKLGVALGLANSYLKRCARKGFIKIQQAPANRYLYYLTPKGFTEKSRLTAEYLSISFAFYGRAGDSLSELFSDCERRGISSILLCGVSELAEIATLRANEHQLTIAGIYDPEFAGKRFLNFSVYRELSGLPEHDACLLTTLVDTVNFHDQLVSVYGDDEILVPSILGLNTNSKT